MPEAGFVVATTVSPDGPETETEPGAEAVVAPPRKGAPQQAPPLPPPARGTPVYVNVCTSEKVAVATSSQTRGPGGASGQGWSIPFTLGGQQSVLASEKCRTIDFVCHPDTRKLTQRSKALLKLVAETAVEEAEKVLGAPLLRAYRIPPEAYRGEEDQDKPRVQSIRTGLKSKNEVETPSPGGDTGAESLAASEKRSDFNFKRATERPKKKAPPPAEGKPGYLYSSGEVVPVFKLVHRGDMDMAEYWQGQEPASAGRTIPKELELQVKLEKLNSAKLVDLEVTTSHIKLLCKGKYRLEVQLPFRVLEEEGSAKFDKASRTLVVTVPVVPPKRREAVPFQEPEPEPEPEPELEPEPEPEPETQDSDQKRRTLPEKKGMAHSEAQRAWDTLHQSRDENKIPPDTAEPEEPGRCEGRGGGGVTSDGGTVAAPEASGGFSVSENLEGDFAASQTFAGLRRGYVFTRGSRGQGYYRDGSQEVLDERGSDGRTGVRETEAPCEQASGRGEEPTLVGSMIKPRLGTEFLDDLD